MKKSTFKPKSPKLNGMAGSLMTHMRKVAYQDIRIEASRTMTKAERLRDDQGMLDAAEAKRQRKLDKRKTK